MARLDEEQGKLELATAEAAREAAGRWPEARREALADVQALERAWSRATVETRRHALRVLARRIVLRPEGPEIEWVTAEELAADHTRMSREVGGASQFLMQACGADGRYPPTGERFADTLQHPVQTCKAERRRVAEALQSRGA